MRIEKTGLKKFISYLLFLIVTTAYCVESASMLAKVLKDDTCICMEDDDCEKEDAESEKSLQKDEKAYFPHENTIHSHSAADILVLNPFGHPVNSAISSSDHSQMIDSPPDFC